MKSIEMNNGGPVMPRSKSRAIVRSLMSPGFSRWPMPGGRTQAVVRRSYSHAAVRLPRLAPTAWGIGESTCSRTNTTPTSPSGAVRSSPRWTAPTRLPIAMANSAGSDPRSTRSVHHATANARSACGSTPANVHSLRARSRSITSLALRHLYLGRVLGCHTVYRRVARCEAALPRPLFRNLIDSLPTRSRRLPHGRQAAFPEATTGGSPPRAARPRARAAARRARPPRVQGRDRRLADGAAWGQAGGTTVHSLAPARAQPGDAGGHRGVYDQGDARIPGMAGGLLAAHRRAAR